MIIVITQLNTNLGNPSVFQHNDLIHLGQKMNTMSDKQTSLQGNKNTRELATPFSVKTEFGAGLAGLARKVRVRNHSKAITL